MYALFGCFCFLLSFLTGDSNCASTRCCAIGCDVFSAFRQSTAFTKCPTTPICSPKWKKKKSSSASPLGASPPLFSSRFSLFHPFETRPLFEVPHLAARNLCTAGAQRNNCIPLVRVETLKKTPKRRRRFTGWCHWCVK